jgi:integrase/recombinase XerD
VNGLEAGSPRRGQRTSSDLAALADTYSASIRQRHISVSAWKSRVRALSRFVKFLGSRGQRSPQQIRLEDLEEFRQALSNQRAKTGRRRGQPLHQNTVVERMGAVCRFTRWLARQGHILLDPAINLPVMRLARSLPRVLTLNEVDALLSTVTAEDPVTLRDRAILELLYSSALRRSELVGLNVSDLDLLGHEVTIRRGKGGRWRRVPVGAHAAAALEIYLRVGRDRIYRCASAGTADPRAVFLSQQGTRLSGQLACDVVSTRARQAGLSLPVTTHTLRHTAAVHLLKGGADLRHVQELLGHRTMTMTSHYTQLVLDDLKEALARCHPRRRLKV